MNDDPYPLFSRDYKPNEPTGEQLRDEGIALVSANSGSWIQQAFAVVATSVPKDWAGMAEEFRPIVVERIGEPHTPQTWGALTRELIKKGHIGKIGWGTPKDPKSHACQKPSYVKLL